MGHAISSSKVINQGDYKDPDFYASCGKPNASGTISSNGCAICALATFVLHKGGLSSSKKLEAITQVTIEATNPAADVTYDDFKVTVGSKNISVTYDSISDIAAAVDDGEICLVKLQDPNNSRNTHFVLVDGMDYSAEGFDRYLVADPDGGDLKTLQDTFEKRNIKSSASSIVKKYILS